MKSVGMITIYKKNYGAFLQAYALQQTLKKLGCSPEIIRYDYYKDRTVFGVSILEKPSLIRIAKALAVNTIRFIPHKKREQVFLKSIKSQLVESNAYYRNYDKLKKNPPKYDIYITGSDQVFNANLSPQALQARLLCFVEHAVKGSYAASAGTNTIDEKNHVLFYNALSSFNSISVREEGLKDFFEKEYGLTVSRNIDPVFLLTKEEWSGFSSIIPDLPSDYILYYRVLPQNGLKECAEEMSKTLNLPVFAADGHDQFENQIKRNGFLSPEQWIYAFSKAKYIVTNSFHGISFSIIFGKQFIPFIPPKGGERATDLLSNCGLQELTKATTLLTHEEYNALFKQAEKYINAEREAGVDYLNRFCSGQ